MGKSDELDFITKEITRSGFPLEIKAINVLERLGWEVMSPANYLDLEEEKWREIDIKAYRSWNKSSDDKDVGPYRLRVALIIECKKSDLAWVFFKRPRKKEDITYSTGLKYDDFIKVAKLQSLSREISPTAVLSFLDIDSELIAQPPIVKAEVAQSLCDTHALGLLTPRAFSCLMVDKKAHKYKEVKRVKGQGKSKEGEIFEASQVIIKATDHELRLTSQGISAELTLFLHKNVVAPPRTLTIEAIIPIILFDGQLCSWADGQVKKERRVLLEAQSFSRPYFFKGVLASVVRWDYFEQFLKEIMKDCNILVDEINESKDKIDEQLRIILRGALK